MVQQEAASQLFPLHVFDELTVVCNRPMWLAATVVCQNAEATRSGISMQHPRTYLRPSHSVASDCQMRLEDGHGKDEAHAAASATTTSMLGSNVVASAAVSCAWRAPKAQAAMRRASARP